MCDGCKKNPHSAAGNFHRFSLARRLLDLLFIGNDLGTAEHWDGVGFGSLTSTTQIYGAVMRLDVQIGEGRKTFGNCSEIKDGLKFEQIVLVELL